MFVLTLHVLCCNIIGLGRLKGGDHRLKTALTKLENCAVVRKICGRHVHLYHFIYQAISKIASSTTLGCVRWNPDFVVAMTTCGVEILCTGVTSTKVAWSQEFTADNSFTKRLTEYPPFGALSESKQDEDPPSDFDAALRESWNSEMGKQFRKEAFAHQDFTFKRCMKVFYDHLRVAIRGQEAVCKFFLYVKLLFFTLNF